MVKEAYEYLNPEHSSDRMMRQAAMHLGDEVKKVS
jgi:hypothetical protein